MTKPAYTSSISLGNWITIISIVFLAGVGWRGLDVNSDQIERTDDRVTSVAERTRNLEIKDARSDERQTSILNLLSRIDNRLERIEGGSSQ